MPIRVLDAETIGRIAAGEVVERPASIAKELIENSLDAGASSITIEIKDGGCSYLRVTDNGCGIPASEARVAFENHATSKISSGDELTDIMTLGFRGEALPSIAAVSRITMTTRQKDADSGIRISVEGGVIQDIAAAGSPEGTSIVVRDLFFNTPVRKTFLKKPATEAGVLSDMVARLILGNPGVSIRLINNGKTVYHSFGDGDMRHAALAVYGRETAEKLRIMDETEGSIRISGLIGVGEVEKSNRTHQFFFINGRVVRSPLMTQALEAATRTLVTIGQHPMCALSLRLPPHAVDINVHPSKLEVRFRDEAAVRVYVESMISRALLMGKMFEPEREAAKPVVIEEKAAIRVENMPASVAAFSTDDIRSKQTKVHVQQDPVLQKPTVVPDKEPLSRPTVQPAPVYHHPVIEQPQEQPTPVMPSMTLKDDMSATLAAMAKPAAAPIYVPASPIPKPEAIQQTNVFDEKTSKAVLPVEHIRILGVFSSTYILVEYKNTLIIIDQHAAHERILYQEYEKALHKGTHMQQLLTPVIMGMSPRERDAILSNQELLLEAGYEIEPFGDRDIQVRAVPYVLGQAELRPMFMEMIDRLDQLKGATLDRRRSEVIQASCKRAVKAGDRLSEAEIQALVDEMMETDAPPTCPHGRPVLKSFRISDIERMFKRI